MKKKLISDALAPIFINTPALGCPKHPKGSPSNCAFSGKTIDDWDADLPEPALFSIFYAQSQYDLCRDILSDPYFLNALKAVPEPSAQDLAWYNERRKSILYFLEIRANDTPVNLDFVQRKMISVFHHVSLWNFCPESKYENGLKIHGVYDSVSATITMYGTACIAGDIYGSNVKSAALTHRFFFIGAHELGHVLDNVAGRLSNSTENEKIKSEKRANFYGLVLTKALARLLKGMFKNYLDAINQHLDVAAPCDIKIMTATIEKWSKIETYFDQLLQRAKAGIEQNTTAISLISDDWSAWGCVEEN